MRGLLLLTALLFSSSAHAVTIDWVAVPGSETANACDPQGVLCFGSVADTYKIGKYEVTNAQYTEFLNAVAEADTYGLYREYMDPNLHPTEYGGITRTGSSGSYTYSAVAGREDMPVNYVSFWDALRFTNWLENGQPTGDQGNATTEDGAYTLDGYTGDDGSWIDRNEGATIFLPSEDEWYKAAYYDAVSMIYYDYPVGTDTMPTCENPPGGTNSANCLAEWPRPSDWEGDLTDVGSYTGSASPYGTFDQGGNVSEWNEGIRSGWERVHRGAGFYGYNGGLAASWRSSLDPDGSPNSFGFRVAMIPEPSTALLVATGLVGFAAGRWRQRP